MKKKKEEAMNLKKKKKESKRCVWRKITGEEKIKYLHQMQCLEEEASDCQQTSITIYCFQREKKKTQNTKLPSIWDRCQL